jgi:uncharacterized protein (DUF58 family)
MSSGGRPLRVSDHGGGAGGGPGQGPGQDGGQDGGPGSGQDGGPGSGQDGGRGDGDGRAGRGTLRSSLSGLTTRGRSFLAAGMAAAVCAYGLGQPDLLRIGLLLAVLPLLCALVLHRTRYRVVGSRQLTPTRVPARAEARVDLRIDNVSRLPTGLLMLQDSVPYVLGPRPRFVLERTEPGGRREVSYRVRSDLRGSFALGPLQLRLNDPFGMCELIRSFSAWDTLTVIPRVEPLPPVKLACDTTGYGDGRQRSLALAGEDDVIPRGYRHGDDLRRVHWRSTARYGQLMVRREEAPRRAHCTVLLDTRRAAYQGAGPDSPFEWAVSGAASVCLHLLERGCTVRLLTDTGAATPGPEGAGLTGDVSDAAGLLLDTLAGVEHSAEPGLMSAYETLRGGGGRVGGSGGREGLLVAFLGELDEEQAVTVGRMRQRTNGAVAVISRPPRQPPNTTAGAGADGGPGGAAESALAGEGGDQSAPLRTLREAGWTALAGGPGVSLPTLWQEAESAGVNVTAKGPLG